MGWCYWDHPPVAPIGLYVVLGLLAHIPISSMHKHCGPVWRQAQLIDAIGLSGAAVVENYYVAHALACCQEVSRAPPPAAPAAVSTAARPPPPRGGGGGGRRHTPRAAHTQRPCVPLPTYLRALLSSYQGWFYLLLSSGGGIWCGLLGGSSVRSAVGPHIPALSHTHCAYKACCAPTHTHTHRAQRTRSDHACFLTFARVASTRLNVGWSHFNRRRAWSHFNRAEGHRTHMRCITTHYQNAEGVERGNGR
jgi:hypothetical protein